MSAKKSSAFSPLIMVALLIVGAFAFSAFFTLLAFAPELSRGNDARAHALSQSAVGYAGIVRLASDYGEWISVNRADRRTNPPALTVLTPEHPLTQSELSEVGGAAILVVMPKWLVGASPRHPGWVTQEGLLPIQYLNALVDVVAPTPVIDRSTRTDPTALQFYTGKQSDPPTMMTAGPITELQTINVKDIVPIVTDDAGHVVLGRVHDYNNRAVYVLADPDFLNTQGIANLDTARAGLAMIDALHNVDEDEVVFDVTLNGFARARSVFRLMFAPPFLPATLCLFAAACLLAWRAVLRSGPSAEKGRAIAHGKATLADTSAALIRLAHREHKMGAGYAALTGASAAELIGATRKTDEENAALLDSVGQSQGLSTRFSVLAAEAAAAANPARMLEAAKKLHAWKQEMLRATR